ncbi:hypothetical protein DMH01_29675 [Amycolatopsis sp. WAC 04182]|uniref:hypothetical protein n=1 Tax=Amycolatopsis sp. WAC 04182 TaxID=2203198 RepID=UPI000F775592|nr:hypothetical protein [Amycolatopsis sp. WAC 04182]RSN55987.1 hypothetical protein DMH01_29675 [Amycolatopsis sp. WAC 04182]
MPTWLVIIIVIAAILVVGVAAWFVLAEQRKRRLRDTFGPEYDRAVEEHESPREAERELSSRVKRHSDLDIRPLPETTKDRYAQEWALIQEQFVDRPSGAVVEADRVLVSLMAERGYPTEGYDQQLADLSVRHANALRHYRAGHDTLVRHRESEMSTEDMREAMKHYREVFEDLLTDAGEGAESHGKQAPGNRGNGTRRGDDGSARRGTDR